MIRPAELDDAAHFVRIYNPHVLHTIVTFEEDAIDAATLSARIADVHALGLPWLAAERDGAIAGYAYATRWKTRSAYRGTVETAVYVDAAVQARGVGTALYRALLDALARTGVHAALGGIALPNAASVALHEKLGFEKVGQLREVGFKLGRWVDVGYWQRLL